MSLQQLAEGLFRLECIETLNWPPCSEIPENIARQNPSTEFHNVTSNLNSIIQPLDAPLNFVGNVGADGKIENFTEMERKVQDSANMSMSINRAPYKQSNSSSIKGSPCNVPFFPGFLEELEEMLGQSSEKNGCEDERKWLDVLQSDLLKEIPVIGKIKLPEKTPEAAAILERDAVPVPAPEAAEEDFDMFDLLDAVSSAKSFSFSVQNKQTEPKKPEKSPEPVVAEMPVPEIDDLPLKPSEEPPVVFQKPAELKKRFEFSERMEIGSKEALEYQRLSSSLVRKYPFNLDPFQQASVLCMERGESLFVAAHTSAGKTVVAEYAIALCQSHKTRAVYTSPIKALSNQKFRDFKQIFGDVGLVTGDIQLHPEASCLIMTTEILRSMLYNGSEVIRDLEWVVFDEVHYINNEERGHVWEEVLIMLPSHVKIVMLSATVPNCVEFADWVGRIKNRRINVISTDRRPVPLEHFLYTGQDGKTQKDLFKIIDRNGQFLLKGYNDAKDSKTKITEKENGTADKGGRGGARGARGAPRGRGGGGGGGRNWPGKNDKNIYLNLINYMKNIDQLPMVVFVFSRKRCDENAQILSSMDLTTELEKQHVRTFFNQCVHRLKGSDKDLPQVLTMRELCLRGFAVHHSGILPILKEVVELLFQKGYVKILFATETFAMGVNMPARCVVFDSIVKHDGNERRMLNPGEYTQMAGRAGRRGLDSTGTVVIICKDPSIPQPDILKHLISGQALRLESKFRVTYSMILNLLRVEQLKIEDMLQRSYVESDSLRQSKEKKSLLSNVSKQLEQISPIDCPVCSAPESAGLRVYHDTLVRYTSTREMLWPRLYDTPAVHKILSAGRYLIATSAAHGLSNTMVMLVKELNNKQLQVLVATSDINETIQKNLDYQAFIRNTSEECHWLSEEASLLSLARYGPSNCAPPTHSTSYRLCDIPLSSIVALSKKSAKSVQAAEILQEYNMMLIPRFRDRPLSDSMAKLLRQIDTISSELELYKMSEIEQMTYQFDINLEASKLAAFESAMNAPNAFPARHCTRFEEHFRLLRDRVKIEREAAKLEFELSSEALLLSEEYQNRLCVLEELGFVEKKMVTLRGRIGCELHHQELLITELILDYKFHQRSSAELAALLSCLTCQYNSGKDINFPADTVFGEITESVRTVLTKLEKVAARHKSQISDLGCEIRFDLMEVVYQWASGTPFSHIMEMTDCQEGLIVKCIQRLDEVCKGVRNAARIVGDPALVEKMEEVSASIRRDIVFAASLYTTV